MPSSSGSSSLLVQLDSEGEGGMLAATYTMILRKLPERLNQHAIRTPETHIVRAQKFSRNLGKVKGKAIPLQA